MKISYDEIAEKVDEAIVCFLDLYEEVDDDKLKVYIARVLVTLRDLDVLVGFSDQQKEQKK